MTGVIFVEHFTPLLRKSVIIPLKLGNVASLVVKVLKPSYITSPISLIPGSVYNWPKPLGGYTDLKVYVNMQSVKWDSGIAILADHCFTVLLLRVSIT